MTIPTEDHIPEDMDFEPEDPSPPPPATGVIAQYGPGPYTVKEVAQIVDFTAWTVRQWINKPNGHPHRLEAFKLGQRQWRVSYESLMAFVNGGGLTQQGNGDS